MRAQLQVLTGEMIAPVPVQFRGGAVEADQHVVARTVAGILDRLHDQLQRLGMIAEVGSEAALVADGGREALLVQQLLQCVEDLGTAAQRFTERPLADRENHELLEIEAVVGVFTAVDDVHHRHRHLHRPRAAKVTVKRQTGLLGRRLGNRHRNREHRVRPEARLVFGAIEVNQRLVDERLFLGVETDDRLGNLGVDVLDRLQDALAEIAGGVTVTQLDRLARPGRRARRDRGPAHHPRLEEDVAFDGWVATRIQHFAGDDIND
ncbi:MAG: hypothetical protein AW07_02011 [Candidatus Accumulibacter sp. SK-11]|nr:MAG: hypothetical protein AW07_02011 [Candidatus Accumulibacter sp. SK-11]